MLISNKNNSGFTLTELVVAMLIMIVGMLGLLESINVATEYNLKNLLRDEAVQVGEKYMNIQKARPFDALTSAATLSEPSKIRGTGKPYTVNLEIAGEVNNAVAPTKELVVTVSWNYKGVTYQNRVRSPVSIVR